MKPPIRIMSALLQIIATHSLRRGQTENEQALNRLSLQVAHDIRSPLAALDSVLQDVSQLPEDTRVIIRSAAGRIRDIANNLIEKNRELKTVGRQIMGSAVSSNAAELPTSQLLSSLIDPLITEKRLQFRSQINIEIECNLDAAAYGLFAKVQPTEFKRVLSNLVNNSVEALGAKGLVTIHLACAKGYILLKIEDNGPGISSEIMAKLGQQGASYGKAAGSGLGLYHARTCAESWGGCLKIESEVGQGTTVTLSLPQAAAPDWFVSELVLDPDHVVVVVDDDTSIHQIWQRRFSALSTQGCEIKVIHFSIPQDFQAWAAENPEQAERALYLLDYELLGYKETGLSLAEELKIEQQSILVTSRYEEPRILEGCRKLGVQMIPKSLGVLVPIRLNKTAPNRLDAVLIDDDPLVHMTWRLTAAKSGKKFRAFHSATEFFREAGAIDRRTPVHVDVELGDGVGGDKESMRIYELGFNDIYLATGHEPKSFPNLTYLRGIVGKEPPWF